jgi:hypothetical protein
MVVLGAACGVWGVGERVGWCGEVGCGGVLLTQMVRCWCLRLLRGCGLHKLGVIDSYYCII